MKKKNIRILLWGMAQLSLSACFFFAAAFANKELDSQTPSAIELYAAQGLGVTVAESAPFTEWGAFAAAGIGERVQVTVLEGNGSVPAYYQMATPNYGEYAALHFTEGGYFPDDASGKNLAVIPESLATQLFEGKNAKRMLCIDGREFEACGIYEDGGVLAQLGSASIPVVYGNTSKNPDVPAEHLLIRADAGKTAQQQQQETADTMQIPLDGEINDLGRLHQLGDSLLLLGFFLAGLWFVLRLCIFAYRKLVSAYGCKENGAQRELAVFWGASAFLLAAVGFWLLLQLVRIPAVYLPEDNIFDFSYYGQQILSGVQQIHADGRTKDFSRACAVYLFAEAGCTAAAVPFFWAGCQKLRRWLLDG